MNACFAGIQSICINPAARSTLKRWVTFSKKQNDSIPPPPEMTPTMKRALDDVKRVEEKVNYDQLVNDVKDSVFNDKK